MHLQVVQQVNQAGNQAANRRHDLLGNHLDNLLSNQWRDRLQSLVVNQPHNLRINQVGSHHPDRQRQQVNLPVSLRTLPVIQLRDQLFVRHLNLVLNLAAVQLGNQRINLRGFLRGNHQVDLQQDQACSPPRSLVDNLLDIRPVALHDILRFNLLTNPPEILQFVPHAYPRGSPQGNRQGNLLQNHHDDPLHSLPDSQHARFQKNHQSNLRHSRHQCLRVLPANLRVSQLMLLVIQPLDQHFVPLRNDRHNLRRNHQRYRRINHR